MKLEQYRKAMDTERLLFAERYPEYSTFIDNFQANYYGSAKEEVTMGGCYGYYTSICRIVLDHHPKHIIEYGPGFSTVLLHRVIQDLDYTPVVTSYESSPFWFNRLKEMNCDPFGSIQLVDLNIVKEENDIVYVEYVHDLEKHRDVDFILLDGPTNSSYEGSSRNINLNVDRLEKAFDRRIRHTIDGRHETQQYYKVPYTERLTI